MADTEQSDLTTLTVDLLSAYFATNSVDSAQLAGLIKTTHDALKELNAPAPVEDAPAQFTPAVSVRKSLASSDYILSLIDGKPFKMLKRHLATHGLTPAEYRERYKLPKDYPLVAQSYSDARRQVAAKLGLGRKQATASQVSDVPASITEQTAPVTPSPVVSTETNKAKPGAKPKATAAKNAPAAKAKVAPVDTVAKAPAPVAAPAAPVTSSASERTAAPTAKPAAVKTPPKTSAAKKSPASKSKAAPKAPVIEAVPALEAPVEVTAAKKSARKVNAVTSAPVTSAEVPESAAKRAPRKAKTPTETAKG